MEEIWALQAEFERAQATDLVQRLSERNCVEIVLKLVESKRAKLVFSSTGKEFITPGRLKSEVLAEVRSHGGRLATTDLPDLLNVDLVNIEKAASDLTSGSDLFLVNGQIISKVYIDSICSEIAESVLESGMVTMAELSQQFALPVAMLQNELLLRLPSLGENLQCQLHLRNQKLYTDFYVANHDAKARGLLLGCTRPVALQTLVSTYELQEKMLMNLIQEMVKNASLPGSVSGGSSSLGTFTPYVYTRAQKHYISWIFSQNNFIDVATLGQVGLPRSSLAEIFPSAIPLQKLFINPVLLSMVEEGIRDALSSDSWFDSRLVLPSQLSPDDISSIVEKAMQSAAPSKTSEKKCQQIGKVFIVTNSFFRTCIDSLEQLINELGTKAAAEAHKTMKQPIPFEESPKKSSSSRKKRNSNAQSDSLPGSSLDPNSVSRALTASFPDCDPALIDGIVKIIMPTLRSQFDKIRDSPYILTDESPDQTNIAQLRRKRIKHWVQAITNLYENFQVFNAANREIASVVETIQPLEQHLIKTVGLEIADSFLRLEVLLNNPLYFEEDKSNLSVENRQNLLGMLPAHISHRITTLSASKTTADYISNVVELGGQCDIQLKDVPKKKLKQAAYTMQSRLLQQVAVEERPEAVLLLVVILLFYRTTGVILHAPYTFIDNLITSLDNGKIPKESIEAINTLREAIRTPTDDLKEKLEQVRSIITSDAKKAKSSN